MKSTMRVILSALVVAAWTGAGLAQDGGRGSEGAKSTRAPTVNGACLNMTKIDYKSDYNTGKSTSSSNYVNVPNGNVTFTQGGAGNGCVIVTFTAESFARLGRVAEIRAVLDASVVAAPGNVWLSGDDDEDGDGRHTRSHAFAFVFPAVAPGVHTVRIQFRNGSLSFGGAVVINKHTVLVEHP